jgi:RimJ/RimL family protein N-acetyltransferase
VNRAQDAWAAHRAHQQAWEDGTGAERAWARASVGYWVAAHARRRGVATHAVLLLARWAFDELGVERLQLTCGPDNRASQRVAERAGFTREALLRSHLPFKGGRRDTVVFSLLPHELENRS